MKYLARHTEMGTDDMVDWWASVWAKQVMSEGKQKKYKQQKCGTHCC